MSDLGRLEHAFDEPPAIPFAGLSEQEATLEMNSSLRWKPDGEVHGCSWEWTRRRDYLADGNQIEIVCLSGCRCAKWRGKNVESDHRMP
jgi:hypothetical protein